MGACDAQSVISRERESKRSQKQMSDLQFTECINKKESLEHTQLFAINSDDFLNNIEPNCNGTSFNFSYKQLSVLLLLRRTMTMRTEMHKVLEIQGE